MFLEGRERERERERLVELNRLRSWGCLSLPVSFKLDWGFYIISVVKTAS